MQGPHLIGEYDVCGETYTLTVPEDEVSRAKITACIERMEAAVEAGDEALFVATMGILLGILTGRGTVEVMTMIPPATIATMIEDFTRWTDHIRPVLPS